MLLLVDVAAYPETDSPFVLLGAITLIVVVLAAVGVFLFLYRRRRPRDRRS